MAMITHCVRLPVLVLASSGRAWFSAIAFHHAPVFISPLKIALKRSLSRGVFAGAPATSLEFGTCVDKFHGEEYKATVMIAKGKETFKELRWFLSETLELNISATILDAMMESLDAKKGGSAKTFLEKNGKAHQVALCALPSKISRHNHPMSVHTVTSFAEKHCPKHGNSRVVIVADPSDAGALASAVAKAFPAFSEKTSDSPAKERNVFVAFASRDGAFAEGLGAARAAAEGVLLAGRLVDTHPEELTTDRFAEECEKIAAEFPDKIQMKQIVGEELKERGYGGLYGVGKAADCPPRLVLLEYNGGDADSETIALVGKGIVYDTGGLSLKTRTAMTGMKHDMAGAAGLLGGFYSAVKLCTPKNIHLILCLAENAIGPSSFRNDDILKMYSGKTVEVNNCDAEGRLVLADGVAHATKHIPRLNLLVDMATLTGAQLIATGKKHAAILCNTQQAQDRAMSAGMRSGDLCFPLLYAPELLMTEFKSHVADMKNSVKDRSNAQTSCAGHFIEAHFHKEYQGEWIHVDMAGPGTNGQRGTGYGVGLVLALVEAPGF